jgi:hypothetical protein
MIKEYVKWEIVGKVSDTVLWDWGKRKSIILLGFQASPHRPSDKGSVDVKTLGWLEAVAWDRARGIRIFGINIHVKFGKKNYWL